MYLLYRHIAPYHVQSSRLYTSLTTSYDLLVWQGHEPGYRRTFADPDLLNGPHLQHLRNENSGTGKRTVRWTTPTQPPN